MGGKALRLIDFGARRRSVQLAFFVEVPLFVIAFLVAWAAGAFGGKPLEDFSWMRHGALAVVHGRSPYMPPDPTLLAHNNQFVYPPVAAYALAPFAALPVHVANVAYLLTCCAAIIAGLLLLGVRDWRCGGAAFLSAPVFFALGIGTIGPLLFLGTAAAWRYRGHATGVAIAVGLSCVAKLFLWPLVIWLVATRRWRAAAGAVGFAIASALLTWSFIGFAGLRDYPRLLRTLDHVQEWKSYSLSGFALALGVPRSVAELLLVAVAITGCVGILHLARGPQGDERAYAAAVFTALLSTPLLWNHYLILLYAPLALARPRLGWAWALPVLLWLSPHLEAAGDAERAAFVLVAVGALAAFLITRAGERKVAADLSPPLSSVRVSP